MLHRLPQNIGNPPKNENDSTRIDKSYIRIIEELYWNQLAELRTAQRVTVTVLIKEGVR